MINYEMNFSVSEVANIFKVEKTIVKKWALNFEEYLALSANPPKGTERKFSVNDIRVLAYVFSYWEENPDIECIKMGLNSDSHFDEIYDNLLVEVIPLFHDYQDHYTPDWKKGVLFAGMAEYGDILTLAKSYKLAGDKLLEYAIKDDNAFDLICPIVYNYRHATELFLKGIVFPEKKNHNLFQLLEEYKIMIKAQFNQNIPSWLQNIILVFHEFDASSTTFRYGGTIKRDEIFIDLHHMRALMQKLEIAFMSISSYEEKT